MGQERMIVTASALTSDAIGGSFKKDDIFTCDTKVAIELEKAKVARKAPEADNSSPVATDADLRAPATPGAQGSSK